MSVAAVPDFDFTYGAGCGFVGSSGIELAMFYRWKVTYASAMLRLPSSEMSAFEEFTYGASPT